MRNKTRTILHMPKKKSKRINDAAREQLAELSQKAIMTKQWQTPSSNTIY